MAGLRKRLPVSVPIYLAHLNELRAREQTVTENVSPHGARILTKRFWRTGEEALIARRTGEFLQVEEWFTVTKKWVAFV